MTTTQAETTHLRRAVEEAVRSVSAGSPTVAGWLALDCAQALLDLARRELGPSLTPEQDEALVQVAARLRTISSYV